MAYDQKLADALREIERLRGALDKIAKMKPEPIADSGFVHGPALLLSNCQREALRALRQSGNKEG